MEAANRAGNRDNIPTSLDSSDTIISKDHICKISKSVKNSRRLQMQGHCVLCLRKVFDSFVNQRNFSDHLLSAPKAVPTSDLLSTFNFLWPFLLNCDLDFNEILMNPGEVFKLTNLKRATTLDQLPPICQCCAKDIQIVEKALKALWLQVEILRKIIKASKANGQFSGRLEQFRKNLQMSNADPQEINFTLKVVNGFGESLELRKDPSGCISPLNSAIIKEDIGTNSHPQTVSKQQNHPDNVSDGEGQFIDDDHDNDANSDYMKKEHDDSKMVELFSGDEGEEECIPKSDNLLNSANSSATLTLYVPPSKKKWVRKKKERMQKCNVCGMKFPLPEIFQHVQSHVGDYAVRCPNRPCPFVFSSTATLANLHSHKCPHIPSEEQKKKQMYICETCGFTTESRLSLRCHLQRSHERGQRNFPCPLANCEKSFSLRQSVDFHLHDHNSDRPKRTQRCDICEKQIGVKNNRHHFNDRHQIQDTDILGCAQCPSLFSTRQALVDHLFIHRFQGMSCDLCQNGGTYYRHCDLREHYTNEHQITWTKYICDGCGKEFFSKDSLYNHKVANCSQGHPGSRQEHPKKFSCDLCDDGSAMFSNESGLVSHKIRVHGEEPFRCASCPQTFTYRRELTRHEKEHAGIPVTKEFKCEVEGCGKVFKSRSKGLDMHMVSHGVGGVECDVCGKKFVNAAGLKTHRNAVHLGLRPHVCETCGESFTSGTSLKRHNLIHTGERPFACEFCGQRFRHREVLKTHVESHEKKGDAFKPSGPMKHVRKRKAQ